MNKHSIMKAPNSLYSLSIKKACVLHFTNLTTFLPQSIIDDLKLQLEVNHIIEQISSNKHVTLNVISQHIANMLELIKLMCSSFHSPEICLINRNGLAIQFVYDDICLAAVKFKARNLFGCFSSIFLFTICTRTKTPEICLATVTEYGYALKYVHEQTHRDLFGCRH